MQGSLACAGTTLFEGSRLRAARTIPRGGYGIDRVISELSALLSDPGYPARAATVGEQVRAERGTVTACDGIERLLEG